MGQALWNNPIIGTVCRSALPGRQTVLLFLSQPDCLPRLTDPWQGAAVWAGQVSYHPVTPPASSIPVCRSALSRGSRRPLARARGSALLSTEWNWKKGHRSIGASPALAQTKPTFVEVKGVITGPVAHDQHRLRPAASERSGDSASARMGISESVLTPAARNMHT